MVNTGTYDLLLQYNEYKGKEYIFLKILCKHITFIMINTTCILRHYDIAGIIQNVALYTN